MPQLLLENPKDLLLEINLSFADDLEIPGDYISRLAIKRLAIWRRQLFKLYRPIVSIADDIKSKDHLLVMPLQQLDRLNQDMTKAAEEIENYLADDPNRTNREYACSLLQVYVEYADKPELSWLSEQFREKRQHLIQRWYVRMGNFKIGNAIQQAMAALKPLVILDPKDLSEKYPLVALIDGVSLRIWHKQKMMEMRVDRQPVRMFWTLLLHTAACTTPKWGNCKSRIRDWKSKLTADIKPLLMQSDSISKVRLKYTAEDIRVLTPQGMMTAQSIHESAKRVLAELCADSD
jgi:hypothetical protein